MKRRGLVDLILVFTRTIDCVTVHTCSRHYVVTARLTSERSGNVIPLSKAFRLLRVLS